MPQAVLGSTYLGHGVDFTSCCNSHDKCALSSVAALPAIIRPGSYSGA